MKDLRKLLKDHGVTQSFIARQLGLSRQTVNSVVLGRASSQRVEEFILEYCDGFIVSEEMEEEDDTAEIETQQSLIREEAGAFCRRWKL